MLYYDHETETFWEQMSGKAVIGPLTGQRLKWLACEMTTWGAWKKKHPQTTILKPVFPDRRYVESERWWTRYRKKGEVWDRFRIQVDPSYREFEQVAILAGGAAGKARCYPYAEIREGVTKDGDITITRSGWSVVFTGRNGKQVPHMTGYWFAWCAYYKDGSVYKSPKAKPAGG